MQRTCAYEYCQKRFECTRPRECCSRSCASKVAQSRRGRPPWEPEAELWLEEKAGTLPFRTLCQRFNTRAKRNNWALRNENAIKVKLQRLNLGKKCTVDNFTRRELARALGISPDRIRGWTRAGLPWTKVARNQSAIRVTDLRAWLLENPQWATGISEQELGWIIGKDAAETIAQADHSDRGYAKPVICLDTGEVFPSVKAASRAKYIDHRSISGAIRRNGKAAGLRWAYRR